MRVVYVVTRWNQPTETFVRREVAAALAAGVRVGVVSLRRADRPDGIVDDAAVDIHHANILRGLRAFPRALRRRPKAVAAGIWRILSRGRPRTWPAHLTAWLSAVGVWQEVDVPDIVLAHFAWVSATAADQLGRMWDVPYAVFAHAHDIYERRCIDRYLADRLRRAGAVFVESERIAADVEGVYGTKPIVMRMGVPVGFVLEAPPERTAPACPLVLSVGALRAKKGHDQLIRAVAELDDVKLCIAGDGPDGPSLEGLVRQLGVSDRVRLLGKRTPTEVRALLDEADVFCLASRPTATGDRDGVPNVLIEAMARGVPVVSTPVAGIPDLLADRCGFLADDSTPQALRQTLRHVLDDPDESAHRAARALRRVRSDYTTSQNWQRLESHLQEAVDRARAHG